MQHLINIHWMGFRKDSGRGSIWGYFTEVGKPTEKLWEYDMSTGRSGYIYPKCYVFRGKIGKSMLIEEAIMDDTFNESVSSISKNYRRIAEPKKITSKWGVALDEELGMFLTMCKLRG